MSWTVYLSGEIHTDWREQISDGAAAAGLPVTFSAPVTHHESSDDCGVAILGAETDKFWHDQKGARMNAIRTGTLDDGSVFDSSEGRDPLEFTVGSGQIIPGLDRELPGMAAGDKKTVTVAPEDAYGERNPQAEQAIPRDQIPADIPLDIGTGLQMRTPDGRTVNVTVAKVTDDTVTLDANHPLAGKSLTFAFEVVTIG